MNMKNYKDAIVRYSNILMDQGRDSLYERYKHSQTLQEEFTTFDSFVEWSTGLCSQADYEKEDHDFMVEATAKWPTLSADAMRYIETGVL